MKLTTTILFLLFIISITAQDTINQKDANGKKTGYWTITGDMRNLPDYNPKQIVEEGYYMRSRKIGIWKKYWPNGNLKSEIEFKNGRASGSFITYYKNGNIEEKGNWSRDEQSNPNIGIWRKKDYHKIEHIFCDTCITFTTGNKDTKYIFSPPPKQGTINGHYKTYDKDGNILLDGEFKNGSIYNGKYYVYDEFGLLDHVEVYKGGKFAGNGILGSKDKY